MHEVSLSNWWLNALIIPPLLDCTNCCYIISQKYTPLVNLCTNARGRAPTTRQVWAHTPKAKVLRPFSHAPRSRRLARRICCHCSRWPPGRRSRAQKAPNEFLVAFGDVAPANFGPCILDHRECYCRRLDLLCSIQTTLIVQSVFVLFSTVEVKGPIPHSGFNMNSPYNPRVSRACLL